MRLFLSHYPVLQISSLAIDNVAIPAAAPPATGAPHPLGYLLEPWDGLPPGRPQALDLFELSFRRGRQNVVAAYSAGYAIEGEGATVPAAPGPYNASVGAPFGPWASDAGVTYADGVALTAVAGTPGAGQYNASSRGLTALPPPMPAPSSCSPMASSGRDQQCLRRMGGRTLPLSHPDRTKRADRGRPADCLI